MFPSGENRIAMFYFSSDHRVQGPGFEIMVKQHSCDDQMNSHENRLDNNHVNHGNRMNCDRVISRETDIITSPFYPNDYGSGLKCRYTIIKSSNDVCFVRLQFVSFDMESSPDCRADYLMLDATRERLCRNSLMSQERMVAFGPDGQVRLTFNSDAQVARPGFKILMNQIRGSCNNNWNNKASWNTSIYTQTPVSGYYPQQPILPPPINPVNRIGNINPSNFPNIERTRVCNTTSASFVVIASEGYPRFYRPNTDCIYRIKKRDARVCALEVFFQDFSVGSWDSTSTGRCINDFVKISDQYFCGMRKNERVIHDFPDGVNAIDLRFYTDHIPDNYPGFVIEVRQVDTCNGVGRSSFPNLYGSSLPPYDYGSRASTKGVTPYGPVYRSGSTPVGVSSVQPSGGPYCGTQEFTEEKFEILSPGYEKGLYAKFTDCHYTIRKMHYTVCALEVKFKAFSLENSSRNGCDKDFLQFGKDVKICGKLPFDTIRELTLRMSMLSLTDCDFSRRYV